MIKALKGVPGKSGTLAPKPGDSTASRTLFAPSNKNLNLDGKGKREKRKVKKGAGGNHLPFALDRRVNETKYP